VELGNGLRSTGRFDLRSCIDLHGVPESLSGKTALDVGTCDGFWAFEFERRGADRVVGVDIESMAGFDFLPSVRESLGRRAAKRLDRYFWLAHALRESQVEHKICSVYELSPETVGTFDFVFCGSLLLHLRNPFEALLNIRSVTGEMAIIATQISEAIEGDPDRPLLAFGNRQLDLQGPRPQLGSSCVYWYVNTRGLQEMMEYAGFARTEPLEPVPLPPTGARCAVVVGYP
jgi:tRNA (mo5U34)-methyltransferase